ncbi:hypothetical protein J6590_085660 [Homalodisca vitripennis]|nr:hypothetical protein J6590_085660 [Homalodisca vitripennis]
MGGPSITTGGIPPLLSLLLVFLETTGVSGGEKDVCAGEKVVGNDPGSDSTRR